MDPDLVPRQPEVPVDTHTQHGKDSEEGSHGRHAQRTSAAQGDGGRTYWPGGLNALIGSLGPFMIRDTPPAPRPSFSLVVPLFNEEDRLAERGHELAKFIEQYPVGSQLIFVDDGSADATVAAFESLADQHPSLPLRLVRRPHKGKGAAVRAGLAEATADFAGFCDVDLSTPLEHVELVLRAAVMSPVLAIGSRDVAASRLVRPQGPVREFLGKTYNRLVQLTLAPGVSDTQCGAKVASTGTWRAVLEHCHENGFAWDVEAVAVARRLGIVVREVAIDWRHDDRSRVRLGRDGMQMVAALPRISRSVSRVPKGAKSAGRPSGVFDETQAATLIEADSEHWWFRSKGFFVLRALQDHLPDGLGQLPLVDVGAGGGGVTTTLGWRPDRLFSLDGSELLCRQGRDRHALLAMVGVSEAVPIPSGRVGVVTLLDVIEHLEDPSTTLREARRVLDDRGLLLVNVPAHEWLWSGADELLGHVRRYNRPLLRAQLREAGFEPLWMSHVFSWLVLPVWLQRRLVTDRQRQLGLEETSPLVTGLAMVLTRLERLLVRRVPLPIGTSVLCVARKAGSVRA